MLVICIVLGSRPGWWYYSLGHLNREKLTKIYTGGETLFKASIWKGSGQCTPKISIYLKLGKETYLTKRGGGKFGCCPLKEGLRRTNLIPKTRRGRNQHSLAFQIPSASKDVYKYRFFPQTIRDWNDHPESLISS